MKRIVVCTDSHGNKIDPKAHELFRKFVSEYKPQLRLHLGDWMDAEAFRNGASEHERRVGLKEDADAALDFMSWYKPTHVLDGNHDDRLPLYAKHSPGPLADYVVEILSRASDLYAKHGTLHLPYDKRKGVLQIGGLRALHGFFSGVSAPQQTARAFGDCIFGHLHRFTTVSVPNMGKSAVARGIGALCRLDMEYNSRQVNALAQSQGWAYGVIDYQGRYWLANAEIFAGQVAVSDNFRILR